MSKLVIHHYVPLKKNSLNAFFSIEKKKVVMIYSKYSKEIT